MARTSKNRLKSIIEAVQTQLRTIDGTSYFNFHLDEDQVDLGYKSIDECNKFPHLYIASVEESDMPVRRTQFEMYANIELFGYIQKETDTFQEALKLQSDMEQALFADEDFGDKVTGEVVNSSVAAMSNLGVVHMVVRLNSQYLEE
jgi:hypothetical protein